MSFEPHYVNTYIIYGMFIWITIMFLNLIWNTGKSMFLPSDSYKYNSFHPYLTNSKKKRIKYLTDFHFRQKNPNKYDISNKLKIRCKKLDVRLYWSQWKKVKFTDIKKRRLIWKPPELLKLECEKRENVYAK